MEGYCCCLRISPPYHFRCPIRWCIRLFGSSCTSPFQFHEDPLLLHLGAVSRVLASLLCGTNPVLFTRIRRDCHIREMCLACGKSVLCHPAHACASSKSTCTFWTGAWSSLLWKSSSLSRNSRLMATAVLICGRFCCSPSRPPGSEPFPSSPE